MTRKTIITESEGLLNLQSLVEAYEEIAANQMQKVRKSVLDSRLFMEGVTEIFTKVRRSYEQEIARLQKGKRKVAEFSVLPRNGRTIAVFVSANSGLFGDIVERTFSLFISYIETQQCDIVVIGKLGLRMLSDRGINVLYNYYDFPDDYVDLESVSLMMRYLLQYEKIIVFHGEFKSLVDQRPVSTGVSGHDIVVNKTNGSNVTNKSNMVHYLFEPSLREVLQVFEGEILSTLFTQALHESQLAKFASRMFNLDQAMENIETRMGRLAILRRRVEHQIAGRKQLGRIAGMSLWE